MLKKKNSPFARTLALLCVVDSLVSYSVYSLQMQAGKKGLPPCSYLDPVGIDILALAIGVFLITEGLIAIFRERDRPVSKQLTRIARVCIGSSITVIHIIQFAHK